MSKDKENKKTKSRKKKGLLKWIKKHKVATAVISIILICVLIIAGTVGSGGWIFTSGSESKNSPQLSLFAAAGSSAVRDR